MSSFPNPYTIGLDRPGDRVAFQFFNMVYAWMAAGLAVTAVVALGISSNQHLMTSIFNGPALIGLFVCQIVLVIAVSAAVNRIGATLATVLFLLYAALNGLTLSGLFLVYAKASLTGAFGVTAGMFAATSIYGMVTKRDLTALRSLLFMGLIGVIIATVVNIFWANNILYWVSTYAGVIIFVGLTAYDTQKLKQIAYQTADAPAMAARLAVTGALSLYLDFLNLFLFILRIMGDRR